MTDAEYDAYWARENARFLAIASQRYRDGDYWGCRVALHANVLGEQMRLAIKGWQMANGVWRDPPAAQEPSDG